MAPHREHTNRIYIGTCPVGGGSPVSIQSMTNTATTDVKGTIAQIEDLEKAGCDIVRVSIPDEDSLKAFGKIKKGIRLPLIADIHFDHRLAIGAIEEGADGIRINPGNIGGKERLKAVAKLLLSVKYPSGSGSISARSRGHFLQNLQMIMWVP